MAAYRCTVVAAFVFVDSDISHDGPEDMVEAVGVGQDVNKGV
jgi:hypothetical protein